MNRHQPTMYQIWFEDRPFIRLVYTSVWLQEFKVSVSQNRQMSRQPISLWRLYSVVIAQLCLLAQRKDFRGSERVDIFFLHMHRPRFSNDNHYIVRVFRLIKYVNRHCLGGTNNHWQPVYNGFDICRRGLSDNAVLSQRTHDVITTSLLLPNDALALFRRNDIIMRWHKCVLIAKKPLTTVDIYNWIMDTYY